MSFNHHTGIFSQETLNTKTAIKKEKEKEKSVPPIKEINVELSEKNEVKNSGNIQYI
jgi:hypothetical protein